MKKRCRHGRAWPTIFGNICGILWCPDCGARRSVRCSTEGNSFRADGPWIYPRGQADVLRQLERAEKRS